jgi:hypothetical protein
MQEESQQGEGLRSQQLGRFVDWDSRFAGFEEQQSSLSGMVLVE